MSIFSIIIFSSFYLIFSNQMLTVFIILNNVFFFYFFFKMSLTSWVGYWFLISYNSGILILLLYMSSMSSFEKTKLFLFVMNITFLFFMFLYFKQYMWNKFLLNIDETHFFVLENKNFLLIMMSTFLIIVILLMMSKMLNSTKTPARMM